MSVFGIYFSSEGNRFLLVRVAELFCVSEFGMSIFWQVMGSVMFISLLGDSVLSCVFAAWWSL